MKRAVLSLVGLAFSLACFGVPASGAPATPAATVFNAWLAAFNSGDRAQVTHFLQTYRPDRLSRVAEELNLRVSTGGFDLRKITASTPTRITAVMQERLSDEFFETTFVVQAAPPYYIEKRMMRPLERPAEFALPHLAQPALLTQLGQRLQRESAADRFAGAVLLAKDGTPVFARAYGLADRAKKTANALDTRFRLGSMNKMFTAVATMQLVQAGKIDLDKPFGTYLTDYPNKSVSQAVTIRQLLTHTGGTGDIFGPEYDKNRLKLRTLQDYIDLYGTRPLLFTPGSRWDYSNYGFVLLGAVIQKVSGEDYYDYVQKHIYAPAGMTATSSEPEDVVVPNRSVGYMRGDDGRWQPNTDTLPYRGTSAGGGYSTVGDLLRFASALQAHTLLDAEHTQLLTTGKIETPIGRYGFGFDEQTINGTHCFGHGGGAPGMNGELKICPESQYTIVVLANLDPPAAGRIADFIANRLPKP